MLNPYLLPTLLLAATLFGGGWYLSKWSATPRRRAFGMTVAILVAVPALVHALYYFHLFDDWLAFYRWRSLPGSELAGAGVGLLAGYVFFRPAPSKRRLRTTLRAGLVLVSLVVTVTPWAKQLVSPLSDTALLDRWSDGVCLQSTPSSCGPCAAATVVRALGLEVAETELVRASFTTATGTEVWYLARALRERGLAVRFEERAPDGLDFPLPSVAGVRLGGPSGPGHFVALLERTADGFVVGDPLTGREVLSLDQFRRRYALTGFFLVIRR